MRVFGWGFQQGCNVQSFGWITLVKMQNHEKNWLLIKKDDRFADPDWKLETILPLKKAARK